MEAVRLQSKSCALQNMLVVVLSYSFYFEGKRYSFLIRCTTAQLVVNKYLQRNIKNYRQLWQPKHSQGGFRCSIFFEFDITFLGISLHFLSNVHMTSHCQPVFKMEKRDNQSKRLTQFLHQAAESFLMLLTQEGRLCFEITLIWPLEELLCSLFSTSRGFSCIKHKCSYAWRPHLPPLARVEGCMWVRSRPPEPQGWLWWCWPRGPDAASPPPAAGS